MVHRTSSLQQIETSDDDLPLSNSKKAISTTDLTAQQQQQQQQRIKNTPRRNSLRLSIDHQNFHLNKVNVPPTSPIKKQKNAAEKQIRLKTKQSDVVDSNNSVCNNKSVKINKLHLQPPSSSSSSSSSSCTSKTPIKQNVEVTVKLKRNECVQLNKNGNTNVDDTVQLDDTQFSTTINEQDETTSITTTPILHDTDQKDKDETSLNTSTGIICRLPLERLSGIIDTLTRIDNASTSNNVDNLSQLSANNAAAIGNRTLCLYCDRSFSSQKLLAKHTERIHQAAEGRRLSARKPNTSSLLYPGCSHCNNGKTTSLLADELPALFEHLVDIHFDKYFACKLCTIRFTNKENLQQHTDEIHAVTVAAAVVVTNITATDIAFKQPSKTPIYDKRKKKSLKVSVSDENLSSTNDNDDSIHSTDDSIDTTLDAEVEKNLTNIESSKFSLRSSRRQQEAKSSGGSINNDLPPPKTSTPLLRKKQMLSNEPTPLLSRLGIAQNRSPRTRRGLKTNRNNDTEAYRSDTPTGGAGSSSSSTSSTAAATPRSRNKNSRSNSATNVTSANTLCDGVIADSQSAIAINAQSRTTNGANKVSASDTPNGSFDENFYESVCTNVRLNLSCHLDGKLESGPTSPSPVTAVASAHIPAVSSTLVKTPLISDPELHEATALATITAFPTLLTAHQYGVEPHMGKIKKPITKNSWKWKWDSAKKYKWFNEGGKMVKKIKPPAGGLRDLSRLDMWTQLSMRMRHEQQQRSQIIDINHKELAGEQNVTQIDASKLEKQKLIDQLSDILDRRVLPQINLEQNDQRIIKFEQIEHDELNNETVTNKSSNSNADADAPDDLLSILRLNRVQKSIANKTNAANVQNTNASTSLILSGEWARPRCYICYGCGAKFETVKNLEDHQILRHPHVFTTHYEIVGKELIEGNLFRHFYIPSSALNQHTEYKQRQATNNATIVQQQPTTPPSVVDNNQQRKDPQQNNNILVEDSMDSVTSFSASMSKSDSFDMDTNSRNSKESSNTVLTTRSAPVVSTSISSFAIVDATPTNYNASSTLRRSCTKCKRLCSGRVDLYRHMLDCSGDYAWFLAKKRHNIKYRYFGSRKRKVNRTNYAHRRAAIRPKKEESSGETTPRTKEPHTPKPRPSDAESIQRMLANLPAKRACRQIFPNLVQKRTRKLIASVNSAAALRHKQILGKQTNQSGTGRSTRSYKYVTSSTNAAAIGKNLNIRKKLMKQQQQATQSSLSSSSTSTSPSPSTDTTTTTTAGATKSRVQLAQRKTRSSLNQNDSSSAETQSNPEKNDDFMKTLRSKTLRVVSKIKNSFHRPLKRTRIVRSIVNANTEETASNLNENVDKTVKNDIPKPTNGASRSTIIRRALSFRKSRRKIQETVESNKTTSDKVSNDVETKIVTETITEPENNEMNDNDNKVSITKKPKGKTFKKFFKNIGKNCSQKSYTTTPDKDIVQPYVRVTDVIKQKTFLVDKSKSDEDAGKKSPDHTKLDDKSTATTNTIPVTKEKETNVDKIVAAEPPKLDKEKIVDLPQSATKIDSISERLLQEDDTLSNASEASNTPSITQTPSSPMKTPPSAKRKPRKLNDCIAMLTGKLQEKLGVPFLENDCNVLMQSSVRSVHQAVMEDDDDEPTAVPQTSTPVAGDTSIENTPKKRRGRKPKNLVMVQQRPVFNLEMPEHPIGSKNLEPLPQSIPSIFDGIKRNIPKVSKNYQNLYDSYNNDDDDDNIDDDDDNMEQEQPINLVVPKERHGRGASSNTLSTKPAILSIPLSNDANNFSSKIGIELNKFSTIMIPETTTFSSPYLHSPPASLRSPTEDINLLRTTTSELRKLRKTKSTRSLSPSSSIFTIDTLLKPIQPLSNVGVDRDTGTLDLSTHHFAYKQTQQLYANQTACASSVSINMPLNRPISNSMISPPLPQKTRKETSSEILTRIINEVAMGPRDDNDDVTPPTINVPNDKTDNSSLKKCAKMIVPLVVTKLSEEIRVQDSKIAKSLKTTVLSIPTMPLPETKLIEHPLKDAVSRTPSSVAKISAIIDISATDIQTNEQVQNIASKDQSITIPSNDNQPQNLSTKLEPEKLINEPSLPEANKVLPPEDKVTTEISVTKPKVNKKQPARGKKKTKIDNSSVNDAKDLPDKLSEPQKIENSSAKDLPENLSEPKKIDSEEPPKETALSSTESKIDETIDKSTTKEKMVQEKASKKVTGRTKQKCQSVPENVPEIPEVAVVTKEPIISNTPTIDLCEKSTESVEPKKVAGRKPPKSAVVTEKVTELSSEISDSNVPAIELNEKPTEAIESPSKLPNRKTANKKSKAKPSQADKKTTENALPDESIPMKDNDLKETPPNQQESSTKAKPKSPANESVQIKDNDLKENPSNQQDMVTPESSSKTKPKSPAKAKSKSPANESIQTKDNDLEEKPSNQQDMLTPDSSSKTKPKSPAKSKPKSPAKTSATSVKSNNSELLDIEDDENMVLADIQKKNAGNLDKSTDKKTKSAVPQTKTKSTVKSKQASKQLDAKLVNSSDETNSDNVVLEVKSIPKKESAKKAKTSIVKEPVSVSSSKPKSDSKPARKTNAAAKSEEIKPADSNDIEKAKDDDILKPVTEDCEVTEKTKIPSENESKKKPEEKSQPKTKPSKSDAAKLIDSNDENIREDVILEVKSIPKKVTENSNKKVKSSVVVEPTVSPSPTRATKLKSLRTSTKVSTTGDTMFDSSEDELLPWDPEIGFVNRSQDDEKPSEEKSNEIEKTTNEKLPESDSQEALKTDTNTPEPTVPPVTKPRKRRKNELAKIIADQLLESFKEVDQARIEELKILHNLSIDNNSTTADDMLISATLSATPPPKRKTAANIASDALVDLDTSFEEVDSESEVEIAKGNSATREKNVSTAKITKSKASKKMATNDKKAPKSESQSTTLDGTNKRKLSVTQLNLMKKNRRGNVTEKNSGKDLISDVEETNADNDKSTTKITGKKQRRTIISDKEKCASDVISSDEVENKVKNLRRHVVEKKIEIDSTETTIANPAPKTVAKKQRQTDTEKDDKTTSDPVKESIESQPIIAKPMPKSATKGRRHTICGKNPISNNDTAVKEKISPAITDTNDFQSKRAAKDKINENDIDPLPSKSTTIQVDRDTLLLDDKLLKAKIVVSTIKLAPVKPIILDAKTVPSVEVAPTVSISPTSATISEKKPLSGISIKSQHGKIMKKGRGKRSPKKSQKVSPIARTKSNVNDLVAQIINDFTTSTIDSPRKESPVVFGELTKTNLDLLNRTARNNELFNSLKYSTSKTDMEKLPEIGIATKQNHRPSYDHALMGRPKAVENLMQLDRLSATSCMKSPMRAPFMSPRWEPGETDRFDTTAAAAAKLLMPPPPPTTTTSSSSSSSTSSSSSDALIREPVLQKLWQPTKSANNTVDEPSSTAPVVEKSLFQNVKEKTKKLFGKISKRKSKKSDSNKRISPSHTQHTQPKRPLLRPSILSTANVFSAATSTAATGLPSIIGSTTTVASSVDVDSCIKKLETNNLFLGKSLNFTENLSTNIFVKDTNITTSAATADLAKDENLFEKPAESPVTTESPFKLFAKDVPSKKVAFPESELSKPIRVTAKKISRRRQTTTGRRSTKVSLPKPLTPPPMLHRAKSLSTPPMDSLNTAFIQKRPQQQQINRPMNKTAQSLPNKPNKLSSIPSHIFTDARCNSPSSNSSSSGDTFLSQMVDKIRAVNRDQQSESEEDLCLAAIAKSLNNKIMNSDEFNNELDSPPAETANASKPSFVINEKPTTPTLPLSLVNDENSSPVAVETNADPPITNVSTVIDRPDIDQDENTNTDLIDMDLEDCASVYTSFSIDTSFTAGGTAVRRKKRRNRKSIIYRKAKKSDVFLSPNDGHLCDICNKTFRSVGGLHSHKMTLSHISKLSEREFLQQTQANINAEAVESSEQSTQVQFALPSLPPPSSPLTLQPPPAPSPLPKQISITTENSNVRPIIEPIEACVPIEDTSSPSNVIDVAAQEPSASPLLHQAAASPQSTKSAIVSPIRVPPHQSPASASHQQSIPSSYMCQSGIEPISSPEQIDFSYDRYALPTRPTIIPASSHDNSRLALSQEERLFYECCSMLKGSDRSVIPSSALGVASSSPIAKLFYPSGGLRMTPLDEQLVKTTKPVTPKSNEQYSSYLHHPSEHGKGIPKIDMNQFSDISSDSNPAYSCPQVPSQSDTVFANEPPSNAPLSSPSSSPSSLLNIVVGHKHQSIDGSIALQQQLDQNRRHFPASLIGRGFTGAFADVSQNFMSHTHHHGNNNENYLHTIIKQRSPMYGQRNSSYLSPTNTTSNEHQRLLTNIGSLESIVGAGGDGKIETTGSPMDSPLHSTSSQSSTFTVSKPRTKAAMKGYENFKVSIPTTGLDMQQALNRSPNPSGCKLAALADIALGNDVPHAVGLMRSPSALSIVVSGGDDDDHETTDLQTKIATPSPTPPPPPTPEIVIENEPTEEKEVDEEIVIKKPQSSIIDEINENSKPKSIEVPTPATPAAAATTISSSKKTTAKMKKDSTGNRLGFKQKKKVPKTRQPIEKPTLEPRDIYDFEDSHDSMDVPIVSLSHSRTKITGPELTAAIQSITEPSDNLTEIDDNKVPNVNEIDSTIPKPVPPPPPQSVSCEPNATDDINTAANSPASSYSDRDDFNYDSVSESESSASSEAKPEPASRPASRISNRSAKSINNLQKKCLIMGRIFKAAKKTEVATVAAEKSVREQGVVKKPIPKQELDKLFDSLRGGTTGTTSSNVGPTSLSTTKKQSKANENKSTAAANRKDATASSSSAAAAAATTTSSQSSDKKDEKAAKRDAARRSRKPREVANMEAEWGMSMEQIIDLIGVGQRKTQRRCAANKQRTFAETWSSDEYEEFHSTKDIIALIQEAEVKARRARSRSAKNSKKNADNQSKGDDNDDDVNENKNDCSTNVDNDDNKKSVDNSTVEMEKKKIPSNKIAVISDSDPRRKSSTLYNNKEKQQGKDKENKHAPAQTVMSTTGKHAKDDSVVERKKKPIRDENSSSGEILPSTTTTTTAECETTTTIEVGSKKQHQPQPQSTAKPKKSTTFTGVADSDDTDIDSEWSKSVKRSKIKNRRRTIAFHEDDTKVETNTAKSKRNKTPPPPSSRKFDATSKMSAASSSSSSSHQQQQQQQQRNSLMCVGSHKSSSSTKSTGGGDHKPMSRRKRMASEMLYYWSSSSDEEFGRIKPRENYDDDNLEQHGWIVGDSHKKLVTLLAHAKGKKIEDCGVKEAIHKKKS